MKVKENKEYNGWGITKFLFLVSLGIVMPAILIVLNHTNINLTIVCMGCILLYLIVLYHDVTRGNHILSSTTKSYTLKFNDGKKTLDLRTYRDLVGKSNEYIMEAETLEEFEQRIMIEDL